MTIRSMYCQDMINDRRFEMKLPSALYEELEAKAEEQGMSVGAVMREASERMLRYDLCGPQEDARVRRLSRERDAIEGSLRRMARYRREEGNGYIASAILAALDAALEDWTHA